jgi:hypothetical protein
MIDPATGWFKMHQIENKTAAEVADACKKTWFTGHPLPQPIILNQGTEFMAEFARMVKNYDGLKLKPITTRSPQANAIIKLVHKTIRNIIQTFNVQAMDSNDPWTGMLAAAVFAVFAVQATHHTTLQASPMQLLVMFGRVGILNIKHVLDWEHIRQQKQSRINENNRRKNLSRRAHSCSLRDKTLVKARKNSKHELEHAGPYKITQACDDGMVPFQKGIVNDAANIRRVKPFHE